MATEHRTTGLTIRDLEAMFPDEDMAIRELIDGELFVTPTPTRRHQQVVVKLGSRLLAYAQEHGGEVYPSPTGVLFDDPNFVEPDVFYTRAEHDQWQDDRYLRVAPDLVVEISSPSTKRRDRTKKRDLYERFGVAEYWFVDLDADRVEVRRLVEGRFASTEIVARDGVLEPATLGGFSISVSELLGPPEGDAS